MSSREDKRRALPLSCPGLVVVLYAVLTDSGHRLPIHSLVFGVVLALSLMTAASVAGLWSFILLVRRRALVYFIPLTASVVAMVRMCLLFC
jgi:hypothetical protein